MAIHVNAENVAVSNPIVFTLQDNSGAHVTLTACVTGLPPLTHAFAYGEGSASGNLARLAPGQYDCSFTVQAFKYAALSGMYDSRLSVNGMLVAGASGVVPEAGFDVGAGYFTLTVI